MPDQNADIQHFFQVKEKTKIYSSTNTSIQNNTLSTELRNLALASFSFVVLSLAFIGVLFVIHENTVQPSSSANTLALVNVTQGSVQGVSDIVTTYPNRYPSKDYFVSTTVPFTGPVIKSIIDKFPAHSAITLHGNLPSQCLNTDGYFCAASVSKVGICINGICGATNLTFNVTPDANGNWSYTIPTGLDPGDYSVTIKDQSGKVLEVSNFTVSNQSTAVLTNTSVPVSNKNLPNTGVVDDTLKVLDIGAVIVLISFILSKKTFGKKQVL